MALAVVPLQVRVLQVVEGVHLVERGRTGMSPGHELPRRGRGGEVRRDGLRPQAEAREDVRRHVEGVGRGGRDLRVGACRGKRVRRERGVVERVDDVVRDPWMVGVPGQEAVEHPRRLLLARERGVTRRRRGQEGEGVEDRRLVVRGETAGHVRHGDLERLRAGAGVRRGVEIRRRGRCTRARGRWRRRGPPPRLPPPAAAGGPPAAAGSRSGGNSHGDPPLRHAAARILPPRPRTRGALLRSRTNAGAR